MELKDLSEDVRQFRCRRVDVAHLSLCPLAFANRTTFVISVDITEIAPWGVSRNLKLAIFDISLATRLRIRLTACRRYPVEGEDTALKIGRNDVDGTTQDGTRPRGHEVSLITTPSGFDLAAFAARSLGVHHEEPFDVVFKAQLAQDG